MLFEAGNGQIPPELFALEQYWLDSTYLHLFCLIILLTMRPLATLSARGFSCAISGLGWIIERIITSNQKYN